jgi:glyoxylase-like metal-dependent hydrolase (beta-lactamase superfamily II)
MIMGIANQDIIVNNRLEKFDKFIGIDRICLFFHKVVWRRRDMERISICLQKDGPVTSVKMTSSFLGLPLFKVLAFFVDGLLIDTGFIHGRDRFLEVCGTLRPHIIVNTHHHEDHTGNNFWMMKKLGLLPLAHPRTSTYMEAPSQWIRLYRRIVWGTPPPSETGQVDSEIQTPAFRFSVILTPGHADDHICLYEPNEGWLFSGDLFIGEQLRYLREDENIHFRSRFSEEVAALRPKMFCAFSGLVKNRWRFFIIRLNIWKRWARSRKSRQGLSLRRSEETLGRETGSV